tara:strand:+ start:209 stop:490 length:282 start_codon:yes stop_codon:yes gene_type:complete
MDWMSRDGMITPQNMYLAQRHLITDFLNNLQHNTGDGIEVDQVMTLDHDQVTDLHYLIPSWVRASCRITNFLPSQSTMADFELCSMMSIGTRS